MNKRGDIPITILVIGVLAICALAIFSFYTADRNVKSGFAVIQAVEEAGIIGEKISLYREIGFSEEEIKNLFDIKEDIQGKHIIIKQGKLTVRYNIP